MKPRLVVFDMDGTLIRNTDSLLFLCSINSMEQQVLDMVTEKYLSGEMTWIEGDHRLAKEAAGVRVDVLPQEFARRLQVIGGLDSLLQVLRQHGLTTVLLSAGPSEVVGIMADKYGFDHAIGSTYEVRDGVYTGKILHHLGDTGKIEKLQELCDRLGADFASCVALGDGDSDMGLFRRLSRTIALNASKPLRALAARVVDTEDISGLHTVILELLQQKPALSGSAVRG